MEVPFDRLAPEVLRALIAEFVTRDGTEDTDTGTKIAQVEAQVRRGEVVIVFDAETESCNLLTKQEAQKRLRDRG